MINFPNISTDNFYKFLTVLGLIAFCYCSYMISIRFVDNRDTEIETVYQRLELQNQLNDLNDKEQILRTSLGLENNLITSELDSLLKDFNYLDVQDSMKNIIVSKNFIELQQLKNKVLYLNDMIDLHKTKKEDSDFYSNLVIPILFIGLLMGLLIFITGFYNWYEKHQKLINRNLQLDFLQADKIYKTCQSCGKIINDHMLRPREEDRKMNFMYCCDCFKDGCFIEPEITLTEMKKRIYNNLRFKNKLSYKWRIFGMKYLIRWKNQSNT
jgi:hypothetical protein